MEIEIMLTGIGGQGVQLSGQVLARAAILEGREVMTLGTYGGTMRGGNTDQAIVIADEPISTPPIVHKIGSALAMHHEFWQPVEQKLRPGAIVVLNSTVFEGEVNDKQAQVFKVPAAAIATELGTPLAASLVLLAAYASLTGIVKLESLVQGMKQSLPPYRQQHAETNARALEAGYAALAAAPQSVWDNGKENSNG